MVLDGLHVGIFEDGNRGWLLSQESHGGACHSEVTIKTRDARKFARRAHVIKKILQLGDYLRLGALAAMHATNDDISVIGLSDHPESLLGCLLHILLLLDEAGLA